MSSTTTKMQTDPAHIQQAALSVFEVTKAEMENNLRKPPSTDCRRAIAGLLSKHTNLSYAKIGQYAGNRHRTTIEYSVASFLDLCQTDKKFAAKVALIEEKLKDYEGEIKP